MVNGYGQKVLKSRVSCQQNKKFDFEQLLTGFMPIQHPHLKFTEPLKTRSETNYIILHHTEVRGRHGVKEVHQWHLNKGWAGIGYHYYIDKDGQIFEGRPRNAWGAHVKSHNNDSIGVCFEGNFDKEKMSEIQLEASVLLISVLSLAYGNAAIRGHRNFNSSKSCPGKNFPMQELLDRIKNQKKRFVRLYGDPKEVDYDFSLESLDKGHSDKTNIVDNERQNLSVGVSPSVSRFCATQRVNFRFLLKYLD